MSAIRDHLIVSFMRFLDSEISSGTHQEEALESLEVAKQCLESAYSLDLGDTEIDKKYPFSGNLKEIFQAGLEVMAKNQPQAPPPVEVCPEDKEKAEKLKTEGNACMKEEKATEAVDCYSRAIELDRSNAVYYCNRAAAYNKLSQFEDAIDDCNQALNLDPKYSKAFNRKGVAHMSLQQYSEALQSFKSALEIDPENDPYKVSLQQAEQKLAESQQRGAGGNPFGGLNMGGMDFSSVLNNPALMNMASSFMRNPEMQNMMTNMMMGGQPAPGGNPDAQQGINSLLEAGQQLAQQIQETNPDLVDQLREQTRREPDNSEAKPSDNTKGPAESS